MSGVPPAAIGSILQSPAAQAEHVRAEDSEKNARTDAARRGGGPDAIIEIEETDADTQVHSDEGGLGGEGRFDAPPDEPEPDEEPQDSGIHVDRDGKPHIDLSA